MSSVQFDPRAETWKFNFFEYSIIWLMGVYVSVVLLPPIIKVGVGVAWFKEPAGDFFYSDYLMYSVGLCVLWTFILTYRAYNNLACSFEEYRRNAILHHDRLERCLAKALEPRLVQFIIKDARLTPNTDTPKGKKEWVLFGYVLVDCDGLITAATPDHLRLEAREYNKEIHNRFLHAPYYKPAGKDPRTGEYVLRILDAFYTYTVPK